MSARRIVGFVVALLLAVTFGGNEPTPAAPIPVLASGGGGGAEDAGGGGLPTWVTSTSVGDIVEIGSNTLDDVVTADLVGTTGHVGTGREIMANWSGGAIVYDGGQPYLFVHGGGHGDGSINGIYSFGPLFGAGSDTPAWSIEREMSPTPGSDDPYYPDGQPTASHDYNMAVGVGDSFWLTRTSAFYPGGASGDQVNRYDATDGVWDAAAEHPDNPNGGNNHGSAEYANGKIFYIGGSASGGNRTILTIATDTWASTGIGAGQLFDTGVASVYDSARDVIFSYAFGLWETVNATAPHTRSIGNTANSHPEETEHAMAYDPIRDVYAYPGHNNRNVYEMDPDTKEWSTRTFGGATPPDDGHGNGGFGRFRYVSEICGYIYANHHDDGVFFYRSTSCE